MHISASCPFRYVNGQRSLRLSVYRLKSLVHISGINQLIQLTGFFNWTEIQLKINWISVAVSVFGPVHLAIHRSVLSLCLSADLRPSDSV